MSTRHGRTFRDYGKWFIVVIALSLLIVETAAAIRYHTDEDLVVVEAAVEEIRGGGKYRAKRVYVTYTYDGTIYRNVKLVGRSGEEKVGDVFEVMIDPGRPNKIVGYSKGGIAMGLALLPIGIILARMQRPEKRYSF